MNKLLNQIQLNTTTIIRILGTIAFILVIISLAGQLVKYLLGHGSLFGLVQMFNVDAEQNIPTAYSALLLLFAAFLLTIISLLKQSGKDSYILRWKVLSL